MGASYEGKGLIVGHIAKDYDVHVRVGASNAGHTAYVDGEKHVVQAIPVAAYANPEAVCVIGAGAIISLDILNEEIERNRLWRRRNNLPALQLLIDYRAHVVMQHHIDQEGESDLQERIGSTSATASEGIGAASAARLMRDADCYQASNFKDLHQYMSDTVQALHAYREADMRILLEGTQGTGLSITTGDFPYVTSRNPTASGIAADCGIGPKHIGEVILVLRTFPIRVAGNSGPFGPGSQEITFQDLGVSEERTTVTKKVRRIATFSMLQAQEAVNINGATKLAITFSDYIVPDLYGATEIPRDTDKEFKLGVLSEMIDSIESVTGAPVEFLGTGPETVIPMADEANRFRIFQHIQRMQLAKERSGDIEAPEVNN